MQKYLGLNQEAKVKPVDCDICNVIKCTRHLTAPDREPWRRLFITRELDDALAEVSLSTYFVQTETSIVVICEKDNRFIY